MNSSIICIPSLNFYSPVAFLPSKPAVAAAEAGGGAAAAGGAGPAGGAGHPAGGGGAADNQSGGAEGRAGDSEEETGGKHKGPDKTAHSRSGGPTGWGGAAGWRVGREKKNL